MDNFIKDIIFSYIDVPIVVDKYFNQTEDCDDISKKMVDLEKIIASHRKRLYELEIKKQFCGHPILSLKVGDHITLEPSNYNTIVCRVVGIDFHKDKYIVKSHMKVSYMIFNIKSKIMHFLFDIESNRISATLDDNDGFISYGQLRICAINDTPFE